MAREYSDSLRSSPNLRITSSDSGSRAVGQVGVCDRAGQGICFIGLDIDSSTGPAGFRQWNGATLLKRGS